MLIKTLVSLTKQVFRCKLAQRFRAQSPTLRRLFAGTECFAVSGTSENSWMDEETLWEDRNLPLDPRLLRGTVRKIFNHANQQSSFSTVANVSFNARKNEIAFIKNKKKTLLVTACRYMNSDSDYDDMQSWSVHLSLMEGRLQTFAFDVQVCSLCYFHAAPGVVIQMTCSASTMHDLSQSI